MKRKFIALGVLWLISCSTPPPPPPQLTKSEIPPIVEASPSPTAHYTSEITPGNLSDETSQLWQFVEPGFYLPLAVFSDNAVAWELVRKATESNGVIDVYPGTVQQLVIKKKSYYRSLLGPFGTKEIAHKRAAEFDAKKLVDGKVIVEYLKR